MGRRWKTSVETCRVLGTWPSIRSVCVVSLAPFHPAVREWFAASFEAPTEAQTKGWAAIARGESTLLLAPTGSGKTLAAFLWCINRLMFEPAPASAAAKDKPGCRVLYVSPLKALAVDVERNLRAPIAGIAHAATRRGDAYRLPSVLVRTGDTPASERARFQREPADIVITTPESLYLLLTSNAREAFRQPRHADHRRDPRARADQARRAPGAVARAARRDWPSGRCSASACRPRSVRSTKWRGSSAAANAAAVARAKRPTTRVDEAKRSRAERRRARGARDSRRVRAAQRSPRRVSAGHDRRRRTPQAAGAEDRGAGRGHGAPRPADRHPERAGGAGSRCARRSGRRSTRGCSSSSRSHRSTLIFVNSRRIAERLAAALNELAGEPLVRAHHGSLARPQRIEIEDALKAGQLRGLVATSSLELGIDMGAIDLVVQIEAPPSVASGLQRIGRAGHQVGAVSEGLIFPKYRGDLVACAAAARRMHEGLVEATRYPRNPLDVLAQQIVATVAMDRLDGGRALRSRPRRGAVRRPRSRRLRGRARHARRPLSVGRVRRAAAAHHLGPRPPHHRRARGRQARRHRQRRHDPRSRALRRVPRRRAERRRRASASSTRRWCSRAASARRSCSAPRPGASRTSPTIASSSRPRRASRARCRSGRARPRRGRSSSAARSARWCATLRSQPPAAALERLEREHDLDRQAAENLLQYLGDQHAAIGVVPDDRTIVIERCRDELGDWRVCLLSPLGGRVLAPWSMAILARMREETGIDAETMWTDDGLVVRFPDTDEPPDPRLMLPDARRRRGAAAAAARRHVAVCREVSRGRGARAAAAATPLRRTHAAVAAAQARRRSARGRVEVRLVPDAARDRIASACATSSISRRSIATLRDVEQRQIRIVTVDSTVAVAVRRVAALRLRRQLSSTTATRRWPSGARRRCRSTTRSCRRSSATPSCARCSIATPSTRSSASCSTSSRRAAFKTVDGLHDLLLRIGDLSRGGDRGAIRRSQPGVGRRARWSRRAAPMLPADRRRAALRRGRGREPLPRRARRAAAAGPAGVAARAGPRQPLLDLVMRYARTHGPFTADDVARRFALATPAIEATLQARGRRPDACTKATSGRAARGASGASRACWRRSGAGRWRGCGGRSSRWSRRRSAGW